MLKPLTVWITTNCGKFLRRWEKSVCRFLSNLHTDLHAGKEATVRFDMEQQTGSKLGMEYIKAVYCHPAYLTLYVEYIMRNAGMDETQAGIKIAGGNKNNLR